ncbi:uncharacterized protein C20orf85 homolog isoform X2 [Elephas maximus indicus]|uniref:uncharacterized protein C20orf85 homolog isoform X2 n=1 Tax=Elephas maximus indicus TaxID=99487 RepID=UPI0021169C06|nr:uncharacterized protein C20orf85 homolog isoform X2 [Elephas maximus indicus]
MAQKPISTAAAERMNLVAQDEIWKCRLKAETEARKNWAQNWGFLTTPLEQLLECEGEEPPTPKPKIELPESFRIRPVTPVEKYIKMAPPQPSRARRLSSWLHLRMAFPSDGHAGGSVCLHSEMNFQDRLTLHGRKKAAAAPVFPCSQLWVGRRASQRLFHRIPYKSLPVPH